MKMRNLLVGVILGLLAVVHTTPVDTVTQIPTEDEDAFLREAVTDGFLVNGVYLPYLTIDSTVRKTTVQQLSSDSEQGSATEEATASVTFAATTQNVSHAQSSATVSPTDSDDSSPVSSTAQSSESGFTSSSVPREAQSSVDPGYISVSQTTEPAVSTSGLLSTLSSDLDSGNGRVPGQNPATSYSMTSSSNIETSTASSTSTAAFTSHKALGLFEEIDGSGSGLGLTSTEETSTASSTSMAAFTSHKAPRLFEESEEPESTLTEETSTASSTSMAAFTSHKAPRLFEESEGPESTLTEETSTASSTSTAAFTSHKAPRLFEESEEPESTLTEETSTASSTSTAAFTSHKAPRLFEESDGSGSGLGLTSTEDTSTASSTSMASLIRKHPRVFLGSIAKESGEAQKVGENVNPEAQNKAHSTPGWIIILCFIVGVAALVMVFVAIATKEKWNGPKQVSQLESKTDSPDQQRVLEMETFLHKDKPRENGKAAEYTVIPLDEFPDSSH